MQSSISCSLRLTHSELAAQLWAPYYRNVEMERGCRPPACCWGTSRHTTVYYLTLANATCHEQFRTPTLHRNVASSTFRASLADVHTSKSIGLYAQQSGSRKLRIYLCPALYLYLVRLVSILSEPLNIINRNFSLQCFQRVSSFPESFKH